MAYKIIDEHNGTIRFQSQHNPILLPEDIARLAIVVRKLGLDETNKSDSREKIAGRIKLLHEIISRGLRDIEKE